MNWQTRCTVYDPFTPKGSQFLATSTDIHCDHCIFIDLFIENIYTLLLTYQVVSRCTNNFLIAEGLTEDH